MLATILVLYLYRNVYGDNVVVRCDPLEFAQRADEILAARREFGEESERRRCTSSSTIVDVTSCHSSRQSSLDEDGREGENKGVKSLMLPPIMYTSFAYDVEGRLVSCSRSQKSRKDSPGV